MRIFTLRRNAANDSGKQHRRKGAVMVLALAMFVVVLGFAAFTVDFGMVALTKGQIQNAADCSAHAATLEISRSFGPGLELSIDTAEQNARTEAVAMVARFRSGDVNSTIAEQVRDVRFGRRSWNASTEAWDEEWGVLPYNMTEVTVRRTSTVNAALPMSFARILGKDEFDLEAKSICAMSPGVGFYLPPDSPETVGCLPITLDLGSWCDLLAQIHNGAENGYSDNYEWDTDHHNVNRSGDGVPEINIYPDLNSSLAPGNRGTVDLGSANNKTADLVRQIVYGLNAYDLSFFPNNKITFNSDGALYLNGDTGISAGIEDALQSIIGQIRAIPIFIEVTGEGENATYTIVKFVGVRIMDVKLSGGPHRRYLTVQPALFCSNTVIRGDVPVSVDAIMSQPLIVR